MAVPKRRWSKSRRNKRRTHEKLASPILSLCPQCNEPKLPHRVCLHCGTYKGEEIFKEEES